MSLDAKACLEKGAIGAVGAVPGTLAAHPLDVLKMRMQVTGARLAPTTRAVAASGGVGAFYRGVGPGVAQKIVTRGPMFLLAEACTQLTQRASGLPREQALFVGAAGSGYATGALAAPAEWAKVRAGAGARAATAAASLRQLRPRAHAAGLRNALFDSTFFGVEHALRTRAGLPSGASYALAAALAVTLDFPLDVAVKRMMAEPLGAAADAGSSSAVAAVARLFRERGVRATFRGLVPKAAEFTVSYAITGACSATAAKLFFVLLASATGAGGGS